jgi:hypothetical protein
MFYILRPALDISSIGFVINIKLLLAEITAKYHNLFRNNQHTHALQIFKHDFEKWLFYCGLSFLLRILPSWHRGGDVSIACR